MKKWFCALLSLLMLFVSAAGAEDGVSEVKNVPVTAEELHTLWDSLLEMARASLPAGTPEEGDRSEDGYALEYPFGTLWAEETALGDNTAVNVISVTLENLPILREIMVDTEINDVMNQIPCENPDMDGDDETALLYLEGDPDAGYSYGRVFRSGQRVHALQYGVVDQAGEHNLSLTFFTTDESVDSARLEGFMTSFGKESSEALYKELRELRSQAWYSRVPFSRTGTDLEPFCEADLDFLSLSYRTVQPEHFGENVETLMIDNQDGTWLLRVSGDGFEALFSCEDQKGKNARLVSFTFLSDAWEGPRGLRLGDYFQEDFNRFRNGEGELDSDTLTETLYGTPGTAPFGLAEYDAAGDMILRYVTDTLGGEDVELYLRYEDTVLAEMILLTLEETK